MRLEYEEETFLLRRCLFDVQNEIGIGRHEEAYHRACAISFAQAGIPILTKEPHRIRLRDAEVHCLYPDFIAWNAISIELKAVPRHLNRSEFVQLFDYLKYRGDRLGLLVNMGLDRVEIERIVYDAPQTQLVECWDSWSDSIEGADREVGIATREALHAIYHEHKTGYGDEVITKLIHSALKQQKLSAHSNPVAKAVFRGVEVHESALNCLILSDRVVLVASALFDTVDFSVNRCRTYLQALGLRWGIAADFGRSRAEFVALRSNAYPRSPADNAGTIQN